MLGNFSGQESRWRRQSTATRNIDVPNTRDGVSQRAVSAADRRFDMVAMRAPAVGISTPEIGARVAA